MSDGFLFLFRNPIDSEWLTMNGILEMRESAGPNFFAADTIREDQQVCRFLQQSEPQFEELTLNRLRPQTYFASNVNHEQIGLQTTTVESAQILRVSDRGNEPSWNLAAPDWGFLGWMQFVSRGLSGRLRKIAFDSSYFESEFPADGLAIWLAPGVVVDIWLNEVPVPKDFEVRTSLFTYPIV